MKHALLFLMVGCWMGMPCASAQTTASYNERESLTADALTGALVLSWWGKAGRTYFVQQSYDLVHWNYVPYVEIGAEAICGVNFTCSDPRQFWRLNYIDVSTGGLSAGDADADGDGISNSDELNVYHTDPIHFDSDNDGMPDGWEVAHSLNANSAAGDDGAENDPDADGLMNIQEYYYLSDPHNADSDADGLNDAMEALLYFTNPNDADSDGDELSDADEVLDYLTDPWNWDTDGDLLSDEEEINAYHTDPLDKDSDADGLDDSQEVTTYQTNPNAADSDGDGITDSSEVAQGTNATSAASRPAFESVKLVGDSGEGVRKPKQMTITLPTGARSYLVIIAASSEEYPTYTDTASEFDDVVDWKITPAGGTEITGSEHVNNLDAGWKKSETDGLSYLGLVPAAIVKVVTIQGSASGTTSVVIELGATNVSDDDLPTTLAAAVVPVEILQIPLAPDGINVAGYDDGTGWTPAAPASTTAPRFARWRNGFVEPGGVFKQDWIKDDPDRVIIRIVGDVIDPAVPLLNVKMKNIAGVSGRTTDAGFLDLTFTNGAWETEPFLFVTDGIDDTTYNGDQGVDDNTNDQTRLAGFGAEIDIKAQFKSQITPADTLIGTMYQPENTVKVEVNVLQGPVAVTAANKADAQAAFDAARLLYRQIGVDLVQQGDVNVVELPAGFATFIDQEDGGYIDYSTPVDWASATPTGQKFADYLKTLSADTTAIKVFYTTADLKDYGEVMGHGSDPVGWAVFRGDYAIIQLSQRFDRDVAYVTAHEVGHVLGAQHPVGSFPNRIMNETLPTTKGDHTDPRRFSEADEQSFVGGKFYK